MFRFPECYCFIFGLFFNFKYFIYFKCLYIFLFICYSIIYIKYGRHPYMSDIHNFFFDSYFKLYRNIIYYLRSYKY